MSPIKMSFVAACIVLSAAPSLAQQASGVETLLTRGRTYLEDRKFGQAVAAYSEAVSIAPNDADALLRRGNAYLSDGKYREAITDFDEVIRRAPNNAEAFLRRGNATFVLASTNREYYAPAIADYDTAIRLKPDYAVAYFNRAIASARAAGVLRHRSLDEMPAVFESSLADYNEAIRLAPDFAIAYAARANLHRASGRTNSHRLARLDRDEARRLIPNKDNDKWLAAGVLARNQWGRLVSGPKDRDTLYAIVWGPPHRGPAPPPAPTFVVPASPPWAAK